MGFQFVHLTTYSRKTDKAGRSVGYVLDEAERRPDACLHVEAPQPPELVFGMPLADLRALHDARAADARAVDATGKTKKIRIDQHTLATVIASHPGGTPEQVAKWESLTVAWLKDTYGERLASVVRHIDEGHPHLHAYLLPDDPGMKARAMHSGVEAKDLARRESIALGDDGKTQNAKGDRAYKAAMRQWQDRYWEEVGLPCGLARIGPGRRRLSRAEWQAEQAQVERVASLQPLLDKVDKAESCVERGHLTIASLRDQVALAVAERDSAIKAAEVTKASSDQVLLTARKQAAGLVAKAKKEARVILGRAKKEASRLKGLGAVLGGLVQGILGVSPSKIEALVRAEEQGLAAEQVMVVRIELKEVRGELRQERQAKAELVDSVIAIATERDELRAQLYGSPIESLAQIRRPKG